MIRIVAVGMAVVFLSGVAWLALQVGDRSAPITDAIVTIGPTPVMQGEAVQVSVSVFYRRGCAAYIHRMLYDNRGERYAVPDLELPKTEPGLQHSISSIVVSPNFAIGEGRYVSKPSYGCNWLQRAFWPIQMPERFAAFPVVRRAP